MHMPLRSNFQDTEDEDSEKVWFVGSSLNGDGKINGYTNSNNNNYAYSAFLERSEPQWMKIFKGRRASENIGIDEDGYAVDMNDKLALVKKAIRLPLKGMKSVLRRKPGNKPGTLILVRHGESQWNKNKTFTGWADPGTCTHCYRFQRLARDRFFLGESLRILTKFVLFLLYDR